ncbi:DDE-type integrase/transposase/recombinase [Streptomyces sp. NPDC005774]|uniref:DDE-type integrase/transposase/recombinase n=1 Tax=Streptomyces sp. NPDC005774 TaxID=3364728 RepID=UPI0036BA9EF9
MLGITAACRLTGRSRATHYRRLRPAPPRKERAPRVQPSALTAEERAAVLELMNSDEYAELAPAQLWARELDAGRCHRSASTTHRILPEHGQAGEHRRQATYPARAVPEPVATAPSQVFTCDITKTTGPARGIWHHACVIIDIFSRYRVGHTVEAAGSAVRAEELIRETIARNGIVPGTVPTDRGTSMTSGKDSRLLIDLGGDKVALAAEGLQRQPLQRGPVQDHEVHGGPSRTVRLAGPRPRVVRRVHLRIHCRPGHPATRPTSRGRAAHGADEGVVGSVVAPTTTARPVFHSSTRAGVFPSRTRGQY